MLRRHFMEINNNNSGAVDEFPYVNNRDRDFGEPDYVIEYTADKAVRFMGGIVDMRNSYSDMDGNVFYLVRDIYDSKTRKGYWGFQGNNEIIGGLHFSDQTSMILGALDGAIVYTQTGYTQTTNNGKIKKLIIPEGTKTLEGGVFNMSLIMYPDKLEEIIIPDSLELLSVFALPITNCPLFDSPLKITANLSLGDYDNPPYGELVNTNPSKHNTFVDIDLDENHPYYTNPEDCGVLVANTNPGYNTGITLIVTSRKTTRIPSTVYRLGECCFMNSNIETIVIPDNVKRIESYAFCHCKNLKYISIPGGLLFMGNGVFANCPLLTEINYENTIENWKYIAPKYLGNLNNEQIRTIHCTDGDVTI